MVQLGEFLQKMKKIFLSLLVSVLFFGGIESAFSEMAERGVTEKEAEARRNDVDTVNGDYQGYDYADDWNYEEDEGYDYADDWNYKEDEGYDEGITEELSENDSSSPVFSGPGITAGAETLKNKLNGGISKTKSLPKLIEFWIKFLIPIALALAVAAIVWAGFLYISSSVDDGNVEKAKKIVMYVVIGLIVILSANAIVNTFYGTGAPNNTVMTTWITSWTKFLLPIAAVVAVAAIVWAGFLYITSATDDGNAEKAKKIIMYVVVGIIVILSATIIVESFFYNGTKGYKVIDWVVSWTRFLLPITAVVAVAATVWAGFLYVTSAVDDGNVEKAKKIIQYVVIGILVTLAAYAIVNTFLTLVF